jgi:UDP-3-O-[3-hydroxymyristoyl] N-acetylglucosamine deacetylase/3-hydroxyacyl-[acyl-carrier-protein] dehydratase
LRRAGRFKEARPDTIIIGRPILSGAKKAGRNIHVNLKQRTIARDASVSGPGLFTGEPSTLTFSPSPVDSGITFVREHEGKVATIPATIQSMFERPRHTCLRNGTLRVETVEHVLAALSGLGIDNATVKVTGGPTGEVPGGDGSSEPFVKALNEAGPTDQDAEKQPLIIKRPIQLCHDDATIAALPGPTDRLEIIYNFEAPQPLGRQTISFHLGGDDFQRHLAPARSFIFENEVQAIQSRGIGKHLTAKDFLVIGPNGPVDNTYRFPDECARHKLLDLVGDLYLVGRPVCGRIVAHKSGHLLNHLLAKRLLEQDAHTSRELAFHREAALDIRRIQRILPHRYPMLLVDRVLEIDGDTRAVGVKNVTFNDIFFQGHYPGTPIMPGVLIVEALAQLGGLLLSQKLEHTGKLAVLLSMDKVKMRHPVTPGDQLILEAVTVRVKSRTGHVRCKAFVQDKLACEADIKFMLVDAEPV